MIRTTLRPRTGRLLLGLVAVFAAATAAVTGVLVAANEAPAGADRFFGWEYTVSVGGSDGLRLSDVSYDGVQVFDRISLPVMNVFYENDVCGPYTDKVGGSSYQGPFGQDFTLDGVRWRSIGITDFIGHYEITMYYYLSENGDFDAHMFSRGLQCNRYHEHLPFWRMDFDLAGAANDEVWRSTGNGNAVRETREFSSPATAAVDHGWEVRDSVTGDRVTIAFDDGTFTLPGQVIPETDYVENRVYGRQYDSNETVWRGGATRGLFGDDNQVMDDVVLWYSGYMPHSPAEGPTLWHSTGIRLRVNPGAGGEPGTIGDRVTDLDGSGVGGVAIDLFKQAGDGLRSSWLGSTTTDGSGRYDFTVDPGCYVVVFIAPDGSSFPGGGRYLQRSTCVESGQRDLSIDATLASGAQAATIGDRVTFADGQGASGVAVDLFAANGNGSRGPWLGSETTDGTGTYRFAVDAGCYVVVFIAPSGSSFQGGGQYLERRVCVAADASDLSVDAVIAGGAGSALIGDRVSFANGGGASGVVVDLFTATGDGSRGTWLGDDTTNGNGTYGFDVAPGCYVVVFIAPSGSSFQGGGQYLQRLVCVSAGERDLTVDAVLR
ncbi:MAG: hypothetical protein AAGA93_09120 [Actinomycetota bacterium]